MTGGLMDFKARLMEKRRIAWLALAACAAAIAASFLWEGPRTVYMHAIIICLDCIGLV